MIKTPFERVFSKIDRKRILQRVIREKTKIVVKGTQNQICEFQPIAVDDSLNLTGVLIQPLVKDFEKVTALFYSDKERYFITTRIKKKNNFWVLLSDQQFYRLNRRAAFRVKIPAGYDLTYFLSTIRNIEFSRKVPLLEISSGGARIHWTSTKKLAPGTILRGSLQWGKGKVLPVDASVVHHLQDGIFGIRFVHLTAVTTNRLKMLSLELQMDLSAKA